MWSVRFTTLGTALLAWIVASPDILLSAWNVLPAELKSIIPADYLLYITIGLFVLGIFSRVIKQEKIPQPGNDNGASL
jgi:hypothetical protein